MRTRRGVLITGLAACLAVACFLAAAAGAGGRLQTPLGEDVLRAARGSNPGNNSFPSAGACEFNSLVYPEVSQFGCAGNAGSPCIACPTDTYNQVGNGSGTLMAAPGVNCTSQVKKGTCSTNPLYQCMNQQLVTMRFCSGQHPSVGPQ